MPGSIASIGRSAWRSAFQEVRSKGGRREVAPGDLAVGQALGPFRQFRGRVLRHRFDAGQCPLHVRTRLESGLVDLHDEARCRGAVERTAVRSPDHQRGRGNEAVGAIGKDIDEIAASRRRPGQCVRHAAVALRRPRRDQGRAIGRLLRHRLRPQPRAERGGQRLRHRCTVVDLCQRG